MLTHNLGYPRMGKHRELKKANEQYWSGKITLQQLLHSAKLLRIEHWQLQKDAGIDIIPCNDSSLYDHVLDTCLMTGAIPERYHPLLEHQMPETDILFAMARGYQQNKKDVTAMEMTKWFDTNYHYIVPEFTAQQSFNLFSEKIIREFQESKREGFQTKPVLLGPVSFLLLGKEKDKGFHRLALLPKLLPVYINVLKKLDELDVNMIQFDEPCLSLDLTVAERNAFTTVYSAISKQFPSLTILLASYFECYGENLPTVLSLPIDILHLDLIRCPAQLDDIILSNIKQSRLKLSLGVVDGRNIWKNDFTSSLQLIEKASKVIGTERILIAPSCSLLHVPADLDLETDEDSLPLSVKNWMAFAKQKLQEVVTLSKLATNKDDDLLKSKLQENVNTINERKTSSLINRKSVKERIAGLKKEDYTRTNPFPIRKKLQSVSIRLPLFPTTTIGSFPQTKEVRVWRSDYKKGKLSFEEYDALIKQEIASTIQFQEEKGLDVPVHGEFERNDMVEYFGEQLEGFVFTQNGWVQSYGSRCVKPPVIFGDVERKHIMTVKYTAYAQSLTNKPVKGMLTGPVTILQWSFVRNDQPRNITCNQIALAIRDEVADLERSGIKIIQVDEPAIREGLPLRKENHQQYLEWAVNAFRLSTSGVNDATQMHTHMCYSEFNDIIKDIADMDADVITIETSRSQMELLDAFAAFNYPNDIGPGVYDIHSPRVPSIDEIETLLKKAMEVIPADHLWVNPDCGLKTRKWEETSKALNNMVAAAANIRKQITQQV